MLLQSSAIGGETRVFYLRQYNGGGAMSVRVDGGAGVDLGLVSRTLGFDPASARLNGYYLSRSGSGFVCTCVTWDSLADFFAARGLPAGRSPAQPILVEGKPSHGTEVRCSHDHDGVTFEIRRKDELEPESLLKKSGSLDEKFDIPDVGDGQVTDEDCLSIKRKLRLDDDIPLKRRRSALSQTGLPADDSTSSPKVFQNNFSAHSCINGYGKRLRAEELISTLSCKRIK